MDLNLQAGAARVEITPPRGIDLTGFNARDGANVGVHDPLFVRALAFDDGSTRALLLCCDLLGFEANFVRVTRTVIEEATGVPAANIMLACSHTHAGPTSMFLRGCGEISTAYITQLSQNLVAAAREAMSTLCPVRLLAGSTQVKGVAHNRRRADGPLDVQLQVLRVDDEKGETIATLCNFGCHPVTTGPFNRQVSADIPGVLSSQIEEQVGGIALFANGASADINPVMPGGALDCRDGTFEEVSAHGQALAAGAMNIWSELDPVDATRLRVANCSLHLPLLPAPSKEELQATVSEHLAAAQEAMQNLDDATYRYHHAILGWVAATLEELRLNELRTHVEAEVQVFQIGDWALLGVPGELFTTLGQAIKARSRAAQTFVSTYTNGNPGYIPAREEYSHGGYEIDDAYHFYGYPNALAPEAGEMVVEAALQLIESNKTNRSRQNDTMTKGIAIK